MVILSSLLLCLVYVLPSAVKGRRDGIGYVHLLAHAGDVV